MRPRNIPFRRLLRTASVRLAALYVAMFAVSSLVLAGVVLLVARSALEQQVDARIVSETASLMQELRTNGLPALVATVRARDRSAGALDHLVRDPAGVTLAGDLPLPATATPGWLTVVTPPSEGDSEAPEQTRALVSDLGGGRRLAVGDDLGRVVDLEEAVATALLWAVAIAALLGIGGGVLLSRAYLARVDAIARTAEAIIGGDLTRRVPVRGTDDDLDRLAATLNHMLDRIGALMESLRQIGEDVAHDLRTPLSRLTQRLEAARNHAASVGEYEVAVDAAVREADGLLATFSALLRVAQVSGAAARAGFADVDLAGLVEAVVDAYRPDAEEAGYALVATTSPGLLVRGDQELLTQSIANLVENGLRHTPAGTRIHLSARRVSNAVRLVASDDGPGVAAHDLARLTRRFWRAERSRTTPGNGLGLSLVAAVAELHGAALSIEDARPGLRIMLRFPPDHVGIHNPVERRPSIRPTT